MEFKRSSEKLVSLRIMILLPILYMISDFLMDQKEKLDRLDSLHKKARNSDWRAEISEQRQYAYNQALQALRRHEREIPNCVRGYFLGNSKKPGMDEITSELQKMNRYGNYKFNKRVIKGVLITVMAILLLLALFF